MTVAIFVVTAFAVSFVAQLAWIYAGHKQRELYGWLARIVLAFMLFICLYYTIVFVPLIAANDTDLNSYGPAFIRWPLAAFAFISMLAAKAIHMLAKANMEASLFRQSEAELRALIDGLQNEIADIVAVVSHEVRTPLSLIDGYVQLLRGGDIYGALTQEQLDGLAGAGRGLDRLTYVVNRALIVRQSLHEEVFDVSRLISSILADERLWATTRRSRIDNNIVLLYDESTPPIAIEADKEKVKVLMTELIVNAIKFSNIGDTITISTLVNNDNEFVFSVADKGLGIDLNKYGSYIFRPGTQIRTSHMTRKHEGTGYGLAVVKALVEAHGGTIEVESEPDAGSTFTVKLPL